MHPDQNHVFFVCVVNVFLWHFLKLEDISLENLAQNCICESVADSKMRPNTDWICDVFYNVLVL